MNTSDYETTEKLKEIVSISSLAYDAWILEIEETRDASRNKDVDGMEWRIYDHILCEVKDIVGQHSKVILPNSQAQLFRRIDRKSFDSLLRLLTKSRDMYQENYPEENYATICQKTFSALNGMISERGTAHIDLSPNFQSEKERMLERKISRYKNDYKSAKDLQEFLAASFGIHVKLVSTKHQSSEINSVFFGEAPVFPGLSS